MKHATLLISLITLTFLTSAFAEQKTPAHAEAKSKKVQRKIASVDCPSDADAIIKLIQNQVSCYEAQGVAEQCAYGSAIDTQIAGAAYEACSKNFSKLNRKDKKLLSQMEDRCTQKYGKKQGTMYLSMAAFCRLSAAVWWDLLLDENEGL